MRRWALLPGAGVGARGSTVRKDPVPDSACFLKAAKAAGAVISFDLNFREKLWSICGGRGRASEVIGRIVQNVDVLVGNEEDLQQGLGISGPEVAAKSKLDPGIFIGIIEHLTKKHP